MPNVSTTVQLSSSVAVTKHAERWLTLYWLQCIGNATKFKSGVMNETYPSSSQQLRWSQKARSHFWMSYSSGIQMAPSQQLCAGKPPTRSATSTSGPTIHWHTNLRWSYTALEGRCNYALMWVPSTKRPSTSGRPFSLTVTPRTRCDTSSSRRPVSGLRCHPPLCAWFGWGSATSPHCTRSEGLLPSKHHPQTAN